MSAKPDASWSKVCQIFYRNHDNQFEPEEENAECIYIPIFPPLPPRDFFQDPVKQFDKAAVRKFGGPQGE
jgi:hypothetical protein